jgi:hypothetical protein
MDPKGFTTHSVMKWKVTLVERVRHYRTYNILLRLLYDVNKTRIILLRAVFICIKTSLCPSLSFYTLY